MPILVPFGEAKRHVLGAGGSDVHSFAWTNSNFRDNHFRKFSNRVADGMSCTGWWCIGHALARQVGSLGVMNDY